MKRILAVFLILCMGAICAACAEEEEAPVVSVLTVEAAPPEYGDLAVETIYMGTVAPEEEVMVFPLVSGTVTELNCKVGDLVSEGDVLFRIDDTMARLQLNSARASYETAAANIAIAEGASRSLQNSQTEAQLNALWLQLETYQDAYSDTEDQLDELEDQIDDLADAVKSAERAYGAARTDYEIAKAAYQAALNPPAQPSNPSEGAGESSGGEESGTDPSGSGGTGSESGGGTDAGETPSAGANEGETGSGQANGDTGSTTLPAVSEEDLARMKAQMEMKKEAADEAKAIYEQAMTARSSLEATSAQLEAAIDQTDAAYRQASESLHAALEAYNITQEELYPQQDKANDAQLSATHVGIDSAEAQLAFYTVKAPIGGVVESISVAENGMAAAGNPALMISNKENMVVRFGVTEAVSRKLSIGDPVEIERGETVYSGRITEIGTMANQQTRLFDVKASLGPAETLSTGVSVKVRAESGKAAGAMKIPYDALYFLNGKGYVYCVVDGKAVMTEVVTGLMNDTEVEILDGLTPESMVISSWSSQLKDGAAVSVKGAPKAEEPVTAMEIMTGEDQK